jgi:predicted ATPase
MRRTASAHDLDDPLSHLAMPATLHDSLVARFDRLKPVKEVVQIGACIGRDFEYRLLKANLALLSDADQKDALER